MRIDVADLQQLWMEDGSGARFVPDLTGEMPPVVPNGFIHQCSRFARYLTEEVHTIVTEEAVAACPHLDEMLRIDDGIIDTHEGQTCRGCGGYRSRLKGDDWPAWSHGHSRFTCSSTMSWNPTLVLAMTRPTEEERALQRERWDREKPAVIIGTSEGDHRAPLTAPYLLGLEEAIIISAVSCERCMNALFWTYGVKFSDDDHGYPEMSAPWKTSGTSCRFCQHLGFIRQPVDPSEVTPVGGTMVRPEDPF